MRRCRACYPNRAPRLPIIFGGAADDRTVYVAVRPASICPAFSASHDSAGWQGEEIRDAEAVVVSPIIRWVESRDVLALHEDLDRRCCGRRRPQTGESHLRRHGNEIHPKSFVKKNDEISK